MWICVEKKEVEEDGEIEVWERNRAGKVRERW